MGLPRPPGRGGGWYPANLCCNRTPTYCHHHHTAYTVSGDCGTQLIPLLISKQRGVFRAEQHSTAGQGRAHTGVGRTRTHQQRIPCWCIQLGTSSHCILQHTESTVKQHQLILALAAAGPDSRSTCCNQSPIHMRVQRASTSSSSRLSTLECCKSFRNISSRGTHCAAEQQDSSSGAAGWVRSAQNRCCGRAWPSP